MLGVFVVTSLVLSADCAVWVYGETRGFEAPSAAVRLAFSVAGLLIALVVHEGGHRIAGAALGWRCVRFGFGPFEFARAAKVWKRERVKILWGAFVMQVPPSFAGYRREKAVTLVGGPMASLVFGESCALIALTSASPVVFALFGSLGLWSLAWMLMGLVPEEQDGAGTDGYRLWQLLRGGQGFDDMVRETMAEASNTTILRLRDWPHEFVVRRAAGDDPYNIYLAYVHTLDAGDAEAASEYMRRLIAQLPQEKPNPNFAYEAAYWLAMYDGNVSGARNWMERAGRDAFPWLRLRAEAAVELADGQYERAASLANQALARVPTPASCGADEYEIDRLNELRGNVAARAAPVGGSSLD